MSERHEILLCTLNAKFAHASLALRYLYANLDELQERAEICEFVWNQRPSDIAEILLERRPRIIGFGVYIWNALETLELVRLLKSIRPDLVIVLGGPEVSHETEKQELCGLVDYVICGEADFAFHELCRATLAGKGPPHKVIDGGTPPLDELASPYSHYSDNDIAKRSIYVEASRGCPFRCEFCLSSLDLAVRQFPLDAFLADMQELIDRGARQFKFIDRTFNLSPRISSAILEFFLERIELGIFVHFEMVPDRLPRALRELVARFPAGSVQFEIGIQTFDEATSDRISRKQDLGRLEDNLEFLNKSTGVHVHADLIVGLPGEDIHSFGKGFDRLVAMGPHEIQVGILKRLRGTPIVRHSEDYQMVYSQTPPYEIMQNSAYTFEELCRMKRFARAWDLVANRGNFADTKELLWKDRSPFWSFLEFSDWLFSKVGHFTGIALDRLYRLVLTYLTEEKSFEAIDVASVLSRDYLRTRHRLPAFLAEITGESTRFRDGGSASHLPKRQARHVAASKN